MIAGVEVLDVLEQAIADAKRAVDDLSDELAQLDNQLSELTDRKSETIVELARHYLPEATHEAVNRTFVEVREALHSILARQRLEIRRRMEQIAARAPLLRKCEEEVGECTLRADSLRQQIDKQQQMVAEQLATDERLQELATRAAAARATLERNEQRIREIDSEASAKLPAYESSRLFRYLYDRQFGTAAYASRGLIRRMDRWVADLIDYHRALRSYQFLHCTPALMKQELERRRVECEELLQELEQRKQEGCREV